MPTHIQTTRVSESLVRLGLKKSDFGVLLLIPGAAIAWADGEAHHSEVSALMEQRIEEEWLTDIPISEQGMRYFVETFVHSRPTPGVFNEMLDLLQEYLESIPYIRARELRDKITGICVDVANCCGGFLGLFKRISGTELEVLNELSTRLNLQAGHEAVHTLDSLNVSSRRQTAE